MDDGGRKPHLRTLDRSEDSAETAAQWPVRIGDVVDDKYRIERQLGSGGMGIVVAARHLKLGELVALKFLRLEHAGDSHLGERLKREAQATFRLRSEHSVRAMDVGQLPSGSVYIVMELLEGEDLRSILSARGTLPEKDAVSYALQVCDALEDAHALGIIHRDLKPQNLFLARQPRGTSILKVLDFGVSKLDPARFDAAPMTDPEGAVGTPRYMAPEQWGSGTQVDARTDVWALGMILYEMLTGSVPNGRRSAAERQALLMAGAIQSLRALRPEVTPGIEHVVLRCLRADPDRRWRSARRLAVALREARPDVELAPAGLPVTRSDVTAFDPQAHRSEALAQAFGGRSARPSSARPGAPSQVVTRRAASPSMPGYGRLPDPPAADPGPVDRVQVGDRGSQPAAAGRDAQMAARHALVGEHQVAVGIAADDDSARREHQPAAGVEAGDHPQLEPRRRRLAAGGRAVGGMDPGPFIEPDLRQRQIDVAEAPVEHDAAGARAIGQRIEQIADRGVLTAQLQLEVRCLARGVVEHHSHLCRAQGTGPPPAARRPPVAGSIRSGTSQTAPAA